MSQVYPPIWAVIAAYNEEAMIGSVVAEVLPHVTGVIVVDDCSSDTTRSAARTAGAFTARHAMNRGQGAALKTGIDIALAKGADIIVTFDADGQHQASDIRNLVAPVREKKVEVVLGSRFLTADTHSIPRLRRTVLQGGILFTRMISGIALTDTHNGLRAFSRRAASLIQIREDRMAHASEILHEIARLRLRYCEVPVTIRYTEYSKTKRHRQRSTNAIRIVARMIWTKLFYS